MFCSLKNVSKHLKRSISTGSASRPLFLYGNFYVLFATQKKRQKFWLTFFFSHFNLESINQSNHSINETINQSIRFNQNVRQKNQMSLKIEAPNLNIQILSQILSFFECQIFDRLTNWLHFWISLSFIQKTQIFYIKNFRFIEN